MTNVAPIANGPDLSRLNVVLRIEAGRIDLTLGAVDRLAAGALLSLSGPPGQVDLIVQGTVVGTGRLVMVDEGPAVEVLTLARSPEWATNGPPHRAGHDVSRLPEAPK
ncbi:MAG: FliM/FliN family flagellar motor switch protein [Janthinobacterium lividum]